MYVIAILLIAIFVFLESSLVKGWFGETIVKIIIGKTRCDDKIEQYVINDLILETDLNKTSQIDHIVINKYGVFIIETKNYSGRIYGNDSKSEWTQVLNYGRKKNQFYSPVKQNAAHINHLKRVLNDDISFYSVIVFVQGNIKHIDSQNVLDCLDLNKYLRRERTICLDSEKMDILYKRLVKVKESNTVTKLEHIRNINTIQYKISQNICPRCGGQLVTRKGKYGVFIGCKNYPKCRFTKGIRKEML